MGGGDVAGGCVCGVWGVIPARGSGGGLLGARAAEVCGGADDGGQASLEALAQIRGVYEIERQCRQEAEALDLKRTAFYQLRAERR